MEETVVSTLHQLNSSILTQNESNLTEGRVAVSSLALICLRNELLEGSVDHTDEDVDCSLLRYLESCVQEAVTDVGRQQLLSSESFERFEEEADECLFWSHASHLAGLLSNELSQFVSRLKTFSMKCHQLIVSYTKVACQAGLTNQLQALHSCIVQCMSQQLTSCHKPLSHTTDVQQLMDSIQTLAMYHVICHTHQITPTEANSPLSSSEIMKESFQHLSVKFPGQLFTVYQSWLETDKREAFEKSNTVCSGHMTSGGGVLKSVHLLVDSLIVIATVAKESGCAELKKITMECALRLVNNCWEEVAMLARLVPKDLPLTMWYVVLSSLLWLHFQADKMAIQAMDDIKQDSWEELLSSLTDYCNGLREEIVSYHCQFISSCLLHDAHSNDWTNTKPFFEGERCSFSIQMWHYHLCGLQHDLWTLLPAECFEVAVMILMSVLSSSLSHLSRRYSCITPSYSRVNQFKADILTILYTTSHLLSSLPTHFTPLTNVTHASTLIHRSCSHLLAILSLGGSTLEDIECCLSRGEPGMAAGMSAGSGHPLRMTKQHTNWMTYLEPTLTSLNGSDPPNSNMVEGDHDLDGDWSSLVQSPCPNWAALLQALLSQHASLAVKLCRCEGGEAIIPHMAYLLSRCSHCEWALYTVYAALGGSLITIGNQSPCKKSDILVYWLVDCVTKALQSSILSGVTSLHSNIHQHVLSLDHLELALTTSIDGVESKLASQLPPAVMGCLWSLAGVQTNSDTGSTQDDRGVALAKVIGLMLTPWIDITLAQLVSTPLATMDTSYFIAYKHLLLGTTPDNVELNNVQQLNRLLCRPKLRCCISKLGSSFPTSSHLMSHDYPSFVEHEVVAEILLSESKGRSSLTGVHKALKMKWVESNDMLFDKKFNPFKTWNIETRIRGTQQSMEWKRLLDGFTLHYLSKDMLTQLLSSVRWEFQEGAESLLDEREGQLVAAIQEHLCYHDDDCSV